MWLITHSHYLQRRHHRLLCHHHHRLTTAAIAAKNRSRSEARNRIDCSCKSNCNTIKSLTMMLTSIEFISTNQLQLVAWFAPLGRCKKLFERCWQQWRAYRVEMKKYIRPSISLKSVLNEYCNFLPFHIASFVCNNILCLSFFLCSAIVFFLLFPRLI